ncbi:MAG: thiamine-monophosphate kinase [Candidatus Omnitrophica bacterium]|nr:thiamine-monophosphate kinase [Candidatus Omnitrophota bacterium]
MPRNKKKLVKEVGEFGFIALLRRMFPIANKGIVGIGDDAAVFNRINAQKLLFTTDMVIEGVHFKKGTDPLKVGYKALACNISDIAAMGGIPKYALVSLGISPNKEIKYVHALYSGIKQLADKFNVLILGGDTVRSGKLIVNIALIGEANQGKIVKRSTAKAGDLIFVTGELGNSFKSGHHLNFIPRVKESQYLVQNFNPTSMIDISDGLAADLGHIIEESGKGAVIYEEKIPKRGGCSLQQALCDGEDFELVFTLSESEAKRLLNVRKKAFRFFEIGKIIEEGYFLIKKCGTKVELKKTGFKHF